MAHRVTSSVDFYKFCLIAFLIFNNGFPIKGVPGAHSDGSKSPSAKECRAHIEAALEQYWETSDGDNKEGEVAPDSTLSSTQPSESLERETEGPQNEDETDQDDDDTDPPVDVQTQDEFQEGEDYNNGDGDEVGDDDSESKDDFDEQKQRPGNEVNTDGADEEGTEDETADEEVSPGTELDNGKDAEDEDDENDEDDDDEDDEEDDEEVHDEEDQEEKVAALKEAEDETEEVEEDEDEQTGDTIDESTKEVLQQDDANKTSTGDKTDDVSGEKKAEEDEEEEEEDEEEEGKVEAGEQEEEQEEEEQKEENETGEEGDEEDEDEDVEDEDEDKEEDEEEQDEDEEEQDEDEEEEDADEAGHSVQDISTEDADKDSDSLQKDARGDKVTGETHSAPVGMAPELPETEPASDQPKASPVEEKATLESLPKETEGEDEEEEEEGEEETVEEPEDVHKEDEDLIENIYEEEDEEDSVVKPGETLRSRDHVDAILGLDEIGTDYDMEEEKLAQSVFRDIKKIHTTSIKPMEMLYRYADSTTRLLGDAEIFSKPMVLFLGPWNSGKTTVINYLLGLERTPAAFKTGTGITDLDFTVINYGEQRRVTSGTALAADWTYAGLQKFGQGLLDHFKGVTIPHTLLKKITLVDTPGIIESKKNTERGYPFNDAFQWFIDRADAIYVVLDPAKVDIGAELGSVLDQLKGREVRFILNKADTIRRSDLMRVVGQLFWNLSPLMSSTEAPVIYAVSLTTKPFQPSAPARFLADQENNFLYDLRDTIDKRVENRILYARRHAVRVRNHCKMVDCYLSTYYRHKSIFSSKKNVAKLITENPAEYNIYEGLSSMTNVSRYDLPDPTAYKNFFKVHLLYDFKPLASTCSYFRGCPMDKLDLAISNELPELLAKFKKAKLDIPAPVKQEGR